MIHKKNNQEDMYRTNVIKEMDGEPAPIISELTVVESTLICFPAPGFVARNIIGELIGRGTRFLCKIKLLVRKR